MIGPADSLAGLTVLERGWLSSNNIVIHPARGEAGAVLIDTGHVNHAAQTVALLHHALAGAPLAAIVNTHLHSDHCGGNAALARQFGVDARVPKTLLAAVQGWDARRLSHDSTGQSCARFNAAGSVAPGEAFEAGGRHWQALAAPGHDPDSLMLFEPEGGVLISADALWANGFGIVFPEMAGEPGFDDVGATLDLIASLPVRVVIPGHGAPFSDVAAALVRARSRLAAFRTDPERHARHAVKVLLKYHLMEVREQPQDELLAWALSAELVRGVMDATGPRHGLSPEAWCAQQLDELVGAGVLARDQGVVRDCG
jgi:glyoxylase-like metal-dependent hydrolase (beta-lactamase superfamily II)